MPSTGAAAASLTDDLGADLARLDDHHRRRWLSPQRGIDFASNDYLGLAESPALRAIIAAALTRGVPVGAGGSRLLRGNHPEHEAVETEAATFFGAEAALFVSSGFAANGAIFAALPGRDDLVVYDALIHASAHDGMRLGRALTVPAAHNNVAAIETEVAKWRSRSAKGRPWIAVESVYSMDGDRAPLAALIRLAERIDGVLIVDEAHATGVCGPAGRGLAAAWQGRANLITLHTCGKALGVEGALICASGLVRDVLINRARGFIYSTAPSPLMAAAVRGALALLQQQPERIVKLHALIAYAHDRLVSLGAVPTGSAIMPLILGSDSRTMAVAAMVQQTGFDVRGIRPPTVPAGTARLRLSITLNVNERDIDGLADALAGVLK